MSSRFFPEAADRCAGDIGHRRLGSTRLSSVGHHRRPGFMVRKILVDRFLEDWSASVQHQGYLMGEAVLAAVD